VSHPEQLSFFSEVSTANVDYLKGGRILEIGSYDVNGTVRRLFPGVRDYVGVDLQEGPSVDLVAFGHEVADPDGSFHAAISGECFEHDPHWRRTFENMVRLTRPGGVVAFTCASRGRPEHGTGRTTKSDSPGTQSLGLDYYQNLVESDLAQLPLNQWFSTWQSWYLPTSFDLYFAGVRRGSDGGKLPDDSRVRSLQRMMPLPHRVARLPLRALASTGMSESRYQRIVLPYWQGLLRLAGDRVKRSEYT
jgi:SAM-dependent methyltransferase